MSISLRQKKMMKTKHALAMAFIEKLKEQKFDTISIKDICAQTDVSEATFFNYFPQKVDVIAYLLKAKIFKTVWTVRSLQKNMPFTRRVEKTFELFAEEIKHPYVFFEVFSMIAMNKAQIEAFSISCEELQYIYPDCTCEEKIRTISIHDFFEELIDDARNEIPKTLCKHDFAQFLLTILTGVPLSIPVSEFPNITQIYHNHLSILWNIFQL